MHSSGTLESSVWWLGSILCPCLNYLLSQADAEFSILMAVFLSTIYFLAPQWPSQLKPLCSVSTLLCSPGSQHDLPGVIIIPPFLCPFTRIFDMFSPPWTMSPLGSFLLHVSEIKYSSSEESSLVPVMVTASFQVSRGQPNFWYHSFSLVWSWS